MNGTCNDLWNKGVEYRQPWSLFGARVIGKKARNK